MFSLRIRILHFHFARSMFSLRIRILHFHFAHSMFSLRIRVLHFHFARSMFSLRIKETAMLLHMAKFAVFVPFWLPFFLLH
jgi:hypothetical protein